jgi:hypothetical protein
MRVISSIEFPSSDQHESGNLPESWRFGALSFGLTPRPGLIAPLRASFPDAEIIEAGALDGLPAYLIPDVSEDYSSAVYPLITSLRDGTTVRVEEHDLEPLLQEAACRLETQDGVDAILLLCAGSFVDVVGNAEEDTGSRSVRRVPLIKPFTILSASLQSLQLKRLAVLCPDGQEDAIAKRWAAAGFECVTRAIDMEPETPFDEEGVRPLAGWVLEVVDKVERADCVVIDYVGQTALAPEMLAAHIGRPVVDMSQFAIEQLRAIMPVAPVEPPVPPGEDGSGAEGGMLVTETGSWAGDNACNHHMHDRSLCTALSDFFLSSPLTDAGSVAAGAAGSAAAGIATAATSSRKVHVVDLGCGMGEYVRQFRAAGLVAHGFDGNPSTPVLSKGVAGVLDLSRVIPDMRVFGEGAKGDAKYRDTQEGGEDEGMYQHDWVMSLECAEHLPPEYEDQYIKNLCCFHHHGGAREKNGGIVLSWATPGQGGLGHFNERSNDYVEGRMRGFGYVVRVLWCTCWCELYGTEITIHFKFSFTIHFKLSL